MNWDDLKFVLAAAEAGSVNGAARRLGVNHATALRRIAHLEAKLGLSIFERKVTGYTVTRNGAQVVATARRIRDEMIELDRRLSLDSNVMEGQIRVTTTDSLMVSVVGPALRAFQEQHPAVSLDLVMTNEVINLDREHVDVAIRPTRSPPADARAKRPCFLAFGLYAAPDYLRSNPEAPDEHSHWLVVDALQMTAPSQYWMRAHFPDAIERVRAGSFVTLTELAEQGQGLAVLPCCIAGQSDSLVRLGEPLTDIETGLWVMTSGDLVGNARVDAFCDHMMASLRAQSGLLEGREGSKL